MRWSRKDEREWRRGQSVLCSRGRGTTGHCISYLFFDFVFIFTAHIPTPVDELITHQLGRPALHFKIEYFIKETAVGRRDQSVQQESRGLAASERSDEK